MGGGEATFPLCLVSQDEGLSTLGSSLHSRRAGP